MGGAVFSGYPFKNSQTFNTTYTSVVAGSTTVSSSIGAQSFGLGPLYNANLQPFYVSQSVTDRFYSSSTAPVLTFATNSQYLFSQTVQNVAGNGLLLATIPSANTAVIPSAYQDGNFVSISGSSLYYNAGTNDLTNASSSGVYQITSSIGIASGTVVSPYTYLNAQGAFYYYTPVADGTFVNNTNATVTAVSNSVSAFSRSLSGAPYLTTSSLWYYNITGSGMFNPLYNNGNLATVNIGGNSVGAVTAQQTVASVTNGTINNANTVYDSTGTVARATSTVPFLTDTVAFTVYITASGTGTTIQQIGQSSTAFNMTCTAYDRAGGTSTINTGPLYYHLTGSFGQPASSGSLAYFGRAQNYVVSADTSSSETFVDESQRVLVTNDVLNYTGSFFTSSNILTSLDLQVKPGFLVNPGGAYGYWYPNGYGATYKYYIRNFRRTGSIPTLVIDPGVTLGYWSDNTLGKIAIALLFKSSDTTYYTPARIFDVGNLVGPNQTNVAPGGFQNPFTSPIDIYYNGGTSGGGTKINVPIVNANGMYIDGTAAKSSFYLIVRYNGDPTPITNISVTP